jgi:hypothetical protein
MSGPMIRRHCSVIFRELPKRSKVTAYITIQIDSVRPPGAATAVAMVLIPGTKVTRTRYIAIHAFPKILSMEVVLEKTFPGNIAMDEYTLPLFFHGFILILIVLKRSGHVFFLL